MDAPLRVNGRGRLVVDDGAGLPRGAAAPFARGEGFGVLHLGAAEVGRDVDGAVRFFRDFGQRLVSEVCAAVDPQAPVVVPRVSPPAPDALQRMALTTPPMVGGEAIDTGWLTRLWDETLDALAERVREADATVADFLAGQHASWHVVGRVCCHLAENRGDDEYPFAFIATYTRALSARKGTPVHVPLGRALEEYAGARRQAQLVALLEPLSRAAAESELMRELVDAGDVYHPLAWRAHDAHRFLVEVPALERAGLVVRTPPWWQANRRPRPQVRVSVGTKPPSAVGVDAIVSFDVAVTLGGTGLTKRELAALKQAGDGLVSLRGQWVEVDQAQLGRVLDRWDEAARRLETEGITVAEAMRWLAGTPSNVSGDDGGALDAQPEWSEVVAGKWLGKQLEALRDPAIPRAIANHAGLRATLRPYQQRGIAWLASLYRLGLGGCLADDMGLGKTIQVLGLLSLLKKRREPGVDLLVVPASLLANWQAEQARFAPHLRLLVAHASTLPRAELNGLSAETIDAHDMVLTTYGTVRRVATLSSFPWRAVVLDEAQAIKNPGTRQSRAVKALASRWRLALTGTPVENRVGDLWALFDFLNPGLLGNRAAFGRLCRRMSDAETGYAPLRRLVAPYILRRLKVDKHIINDLPDKVEVTAHCLLSPVQARLYQDVVADMKKQIAEREGMERRGLVLATLMALKQICNHPAHWLGTESFAAAASGKFQRLDELCDPIAARQEKVLVFTQFREMTRPLADHLATRFNRPGLVLHGATPVKRRGALVAQFQSDDDVPFMVLSLKAGGTGLNLTAASHVVHFDRWWNPAVEDQATDRAFRIGQRRNVMVHKMVCRGTVEERIDEMICDKRKLARDLLAGDGEINLTELDDEALIALVSLDVDKVAD
ncbi:MAG: DEAD/DEAH box helicase [Myxococcota bacterium]